MDTQFTKITTAPMCTDRGYFFGCAWGDYDNDGFSDLFVADGTWFRTTTNHLYHNNGDGTFARMTTTDVGSVVGDGAVGGAVPGAITTTTVFLTFTLRRITGAGICITITPMAGLLGSRLTVRLLPKRAMAMAYLGATTTVMVFWTCSWRPPAGYHGSRRQFTLSQQR